MELSRSDSPTNDVFKDIVASRQKAKCAAAAIV